MAQRGSLRAGSARTLPQETGKARALLGPLCPRVRENAAGHLLLVLRGPTLPPGSSPRMSRAIQTVLGRCTLPHSAISWGPQCGGRRLRKEKATCPDDSELESWSPPACTCSGLSTCPRLLLPAGQRSLPRCSSAVHLQHRRAGPVATEYASASDLVPFSRNHTPDGDQARLYLTLVVADGLYKVTNPLVKTQTPTLLGTWGKRFDVCSGNSWATTSPRGWHVPAAALTASGGRRPSFRDSDPAFSKRAAPHGGSHQRRRG